MKICIGYKLSQGPWGGGNRFVSNLITTLKSNGHQIVHKLYDKDIDLILILDPRWRHENTTFNSGAVIRYLTFRNKNSIVVHRINECDQRKNTNYINSKIKMVNYCADHSVLVGSWMKDLKLTYSTDLKDISVIKNGADTNIFNNQGHKQWDKKTPIRLVTHHWSNHFMKGFDIYSQIDKMLDQIKWRRKFEFTYIGNLPKNYSFKNIKHIKPLNDEALANELKRHHGYLTASINEPGGNHQNEGALCGLPLIYRKSGCLPEYCNGFGISFEKEPLDQVIIKFIENYDLLYEKISEYPNTAKVTSLKYEKLFINLISKREHIVKKRNLFKSPWHYLRNQLPL